MKNFLFIIFAVLIFSSCNKKKEIPENTLLRFEDKYLTLDDIEEMIPDGISSADSLALFNALVESWVKDEVLTDFAASRLYDLNSIERKVKDYRNSLIVQEYLSKMRESRSPKIDELKVKEYYDRHRNELKIEVPLVKGIFMKINSDAKGKEEIRKLLSSDNIENVDLLEQNWLDKALEYNYFRDKWVDWETVAGLIPHRFGNPDAFLEENKYFETEYGDCSYFLQITEYLPSGNEQPFEFAKTWIADILSQGELAEYERILVTSLVKKSLKDDKLEMIGYDPLTHKWIENGVKEKKEENENKDF